MPPLGLKGPFGRGSEGLWENLHILTLYHYPAERGMVTVSPGDITPSLMTEVAQKVVFLGGAGRQESISLPSQRHADQKWRLNFEILSHPAHQKVTSPITREKLQNCCT